MATCEKDIVKCRRPEELILASLYINPTRYCNLCCRHCWVSPPFKEELEGSEEELPMETIIDIVKEAKKLGLGSVKLTGGEPLLRKDLKELMEYCVSSNVGITMETNGTLVTKDVARMLRRCKVSHISVSIDSASEKIHDLYRGRKGAFSMAMEGIRKLREENLHVQVILSLYKENMKDFRYFTDLMRKIGVVDIKINIISPIGRGADIKDSPDVPTVKEILDFSERLHKMIPKFQGSIFLDIPMAFVRVEEIRRRISKRCAIKNILGILSDGSVSICGVGFVDERLLFGNIRDDPSILRDIWHNNPVLKQIREDIPSKLEGVCGICVFRNRCLGSCRAEVYYNSGNVAAPYWFCQAAYDEGLFPSTRLIPEVLRA